MTELMLLPNNKFHIVTPSPWPVMCSLNIYSFIIGVIIYLNSSNLSLFLVSIFSLMVCMILWFVSIQMETLYLGNHTEEVQKSLKMAFILFIISEAMLFLSFFWGLVSFTMSPSVELGEWPPKGIQIIKPWSIPLLNTILLTASSISITWCHNAIMSNNKTSALTGLMVTVIMAIIFLGVQLKEFKHTQFSITDSVYGSTFFILTGFHGMHVLIGSIFLMVQMARMKQDFHSWNSYVGLETSIWYWHFVDFIWFGVFILLYIWSSK